MTEDLTKSSEAGLAPIENLSLDDIRRFINAAESLIVQGEHFRRRNSETKMILFTGNSGNNLVDMQVQGGGLLRQLIVVAIDMKSARGMKLYINWQDPEQTVHPHLPERAQRFIKGRIPPKMVNLIRKSPTYTGIATFDTPATNEDLKNLTQILEKTKIDRKLLQRVADDEKKKGQYEYERGPAHRKPVGPDIISLLTNKD